MALTAVEKCAGRLFRVKAEWALGAALLDFPDSAPCSAQVSFFRHPCEAVKGRTRAIRLADVTITSPEIWVCWDEDAGELRALTPQEAQERLDDGAVAEYETILAGKFSFTWKRGKCGHCDLIALSREGVFADARPAGKVRQGDLGQEGAWPADLATLKREVGLT